LSVHDRCRLAAGEVLFRTGDAGNVAYLIESGAIEIYLERDNRASTIARLEADDLFGEMALAGDQTRTACARALVETELLVITHDMLDAQLARASPMLRHLLRVTLSRGRDALSMLHAPAGDDSAEVLPQSGGDDRELAVGRLRLERQLHQALQDGELALHYQPIVELGSGRIAGFEALIRWYGRDGMPISPASFIGVAEESELIVRIGHWIIDTATAALAQMNDGLPSTAPFCSINLSPRQFDDPELVPRIADALARHDLDPRRLRLEITESVAVDNFGKVRSLLERCRALGCLLMIDDFGTGYSALSYLHRLPADGLKLDREFVADISDSPGAATIIGAITRLASDLGMYTVAEGIETAVQSALCAQHGVRYGQGFHFSRGVPLADALTLLRDGIRT